MTTTLRVVSRIASLLLAAFFAFVGYWKALGPIDALAEQHAWVAGWPDWFARTIGWSELACALALAVAAIAGLSRLAFWTALLLIVNQLAALVVHVSRSEAAAAGPQNVVLLVFLCLIAIHARRATWRASSRRDLRASNAHPSFDPR
jgi:DoxX-like family